MNANVTLVGTAAEHFNQARLDGHTRNLPTNTPLYEDEAQNLRVRFDSITISRGMNLADALIEYRWCRALVGVQFIDDGYGTRTVSMNLVELVASMVIER